MAKNTRNALVLAAVVLALASGFVLHPANTLRGAEKAAGGGQPRPPGHEVALGSDGDTSPARATLARLTLPDLDQDGVAEQLQVDADGHGLAFVRLRASAGHFTHRVLELPDAPDQLAVRGAAPHWTLVDGRGAVRLGLWVVPGEGKVAPDFVAVAGDTGRRYRYVERGFLKLDAATVIPGFSVGLVALKDGPGLLEALGGPVGPDGRWSPPAPARTSLTLRLDAASRVKAIAYTAPGLVATNGVRPGAGQAELVAHFPGRREGDRWLSAQYGLTARLDREGHARTLEVQLPWADRAEAARKAQAKKG